MARHEARKREKHKARSSLASRLVSNANKEGNSQANGMTNLSKSALRRRKHRNREQLAGNQQGLRDLAEELPSVDHHTQDAETEPRLENLAHAHTTSNTAKSRRRVLARERERQPHILTDLQQASNPFAALRTHARNTMKLGASRSNTMEEDVEMQS
ncbi:hypothetical protein MYAM1_003896 [Malassezia yamatoensis]|uniref:Ribosome biogenesis protein SLX9 n=1 Tax=Malassezia yamatoensis TaxID=253288 RepID=A0AAJ5YVH4_9BASI|nr:hypothetical protein MYAM1_003896 [Malassezia yamatoensis]